MLALALGTILFAAPADDTRAAVTALSEALASHDAAKAASLFTADASVTLVIDPAPAGRPKKLPDEVFVGPDPVRDFADVHAPGWQGTPGEIAVDGERATWTWPLAADRFRALGIERLETRAEATVRDGKIRTLVIVPSAESSARLAAEIPAGNKALVRAYVDRINARDYEVLDDFVARSFDQHSYMPMAGGSQGLKDFYKEFSRAFPDFRFTLEDVVAEGDVVAVRMTARYTHKGEFMGIAPTNKAVVVSKFDFFRMAGGTCVAHWDSVDRLGLLQQLDVLPSLPRWSATAGYEGFR